MKYNID